MEELLNALSFTRCVGSTEAIAFLVFKSVVDFENEI